MKQPRPRRPVGPVLLFFARPLFRYSVTRDAWILRSIGHRRGPVVVRRTT